MKISEILRKAANEHLWDRTGRLGEKEIYSCDAIACVGANSWEAIRFCQSLGLNSYSLSAFNEFESGPKRQGARFLWLHFAALVAEDMGK